MGISLEAFKDELAKQSGVDRNPQPGRCALPAGCAGDGTATAFTDELSANEYRISGLCQACQDKVFAEPDDEPSDDEPAF